MAVYTISQVARYLKEALEADAFLADLWVSGEASNVRRPVSGHTYFTLKDESASLDCVFFRNAGQGADLVTDGARVMVHGRISFYERQGRVNFRADLVVPEGTGDLFLRLQELRLKLEKEGLFEESRKRPLPQFPKVIAVVTSPQGAVFHDIQNILRRRYPLVRLVLVPAPVQGDDAAPLIAEAIEQANRESGADVLIVGRGGGSLEDLWPFNEEVVARAIFASRLPVVSAVGHETDWTIADLVADCRAPTPSAAAEMVTPDVLTLALEVRQRFARATAAVGAGLAERRQMAASLAWRAQGRAPDVDGWRRRVDECCRVGARCVDSLRGLIHARLVGLDGRLAALDPHSTLRRGYAIVQRQADGKVVSSPEHAPKGSALRLTVARGEFGAISGGTSAEADTPAPPSAPALPPVQPRKRAARKSLLDAPRLFE